MSETWEGLLKRQEERVKAVLNLLTEAPYFYREDDENAFNFLRRHRGEFDTFFQRFFGWSLVVDGKCARVYKEKWYNSAITESNRDLFNFTRRDECLAFMMVLEFFEHQLDENSMTVEDRHNVRFCFGDLLEYCARRFREVFGENEKYSEEAIRGRVLRRVVPVLEKYRFLRKLPPPADVTIREEQTIYEALPALYHYNSSYLNKNLEELQAIIGDSGAIPEGAANTGDSDENDEDTEDNGH